MSEEDFKKVNDKIIRGEDITDDENDLVMEVQAQDIADIVKFIRKNYQEKYNLRMNRLYEEMGREMKKHKYWYR